VRSKRSSSSASSSSGLTIDDVVAEVDGEQHQRLVGARLRRRHHLAELGEGHLHQRAGVGVDLVAKSASDAPRVRRTFSPLPRAMPPPIVGAARLSNS
jgi:hypothetical protein